MPRSAIHAERRGNTLAMRIRFDGQSALRVLRTNQDNIQSLIPWLREILTSFRLPHPKSSNVIKPNDYASVIEMYWDIASTQVGARVLYQPFSPHSRWDGPRPDVCVGRH